MFASPKNRTLLSSFALLALGAHALGCGPFLPNRLLDEGGKIILDAPEFYFEFEVENIAKSQPVAWKAVPPALNADRAPTYGQSTADADRADFADALAKGTIKPGDVAKAIAQHVAGRDFLNAPPDATSPLPEEFASEFADYHRGALAYHQHRPEEARTAWKALLARPRHERPYRSTWAAYMLGKLELDAKNPSAAIPWFRQVRSFAKDGGSDSLGLAAASLGWEARCQLDAHDLEEAAQLYFEQLASGDITAVDSLKVVAESALPEASTKEVEPGATLPPLADLPKLASQPLLRKIVTAYLLTHFLTPDYNGENKPLLTRWLGIVEKAQIEKIDDADRLAWLAYGAGDYAAAARWLKLADPQSGLALWVSAKLNFRAGKFAKASDELAQAVRKSPPGEELRNSSFEENFQVLPASVVRGDLGLLQIARGDFLAAFHTLMSGHHWQDAAYLAERVLSVDELRTLVDGEFPATGAVRTGENFYEGGHGGGTDSASPAQQATDMRWLLARRFVRQNRYAEARPYFPKATQTILDEYTAVLDQAEKASAPKERAGALWAAAQLARKNGLELMGTEVEPDAFVWSGDFEETPVAAGREKGLSIRTTLDFKPDAQGHEKEVWTTIKNPLVIPATAAERKRLAKSHVLPEKRWHYRFVAAGLAWKAAHLMSDGDEQTALVLNTAGGWIKDQDDKAANRFYEALTRRCPETALGKQAIARHWFVPPPSE